MFGISFTKILLIAAVIAAVWFGFKYLTRPDKDAEADKRGAKKRGGAPSTGEPGGDAKGGGRAIEDMVRCAVCGAFQARSAGPCERRDCPAR